MGGGGVRNIGYYRYRRIKIFDIKDNGKIMDIVKTEYVRVYTVHYCVWNILNCSAAEIK